jgi:SDR family mycofactocin-dependent oxidoreductase
MSRLEGKVALVTGGARGQGRAHAVRLAREGADLVICDICEYLATPYPGATKEQLEETQALVEGEGRRCVAERIDVRDLPALQALAGRAVAELGRIDILVANAGILSPQPFEEISAEDWSRMLDVNLTGVFHSMQAVVPAMKQQGYGRIVATSSMAGRQAYASNAHYVASKWGVVGLVKAAAIDLGPFGITVNALCPTNVATDMIFNDAVYRLFRPDLENPGVDDIVPLMTQMHPQAVPWIAPEDVADAAAFLVSDQARHITGEVLTVSAGLIASNSA